MKRKPLSACLKFWKWIWIFSLCLGVLEPIGVVSAAIGLRDDPDLIKQVLSDKSAASIVQAVIYGSDYIEYAIGDNGNYTAGTVTGDPENPNDDNQRILFGHPSPGSGAFTLRVDGLDYWNYGGTVIGELIQGPTGIGTTTTRMICEVDGIRLTQEISIVDVGSGRDDTLLISYTYENIDQSPHSVGGRIFWDTYLGNTDGVPFRVPGFGDISTEQEFLSPNVPSFFTALDNLTTPTAQVQGTLTGGAAVLPDRIVFGNWSNLNDTRWSFSVTQGYDILSDSGILIYWNPVELQPGQSKTVATYYGIGEFTSAGNDALAVTVTAPAALTRENNELIPNPFAVSVLVQNRSTSTVENVEVAITIPEGLTIYEEPKKSLLIESERFVQQLGTLEYNQIGQIDWHVLATDEIQGTLDYLVEVTSTGQQPIEIEKSIEIPTGGIVETPTEAPTETRTQTPTERPTETITNTPTDTATASPSPTPWTGDSIHLKSGWPQSVAGYVRSSPAWADLPCGCPRTLFIGVVPPQVGASPLYAWSPDGSPAFGSSAIAFEAGDSIISSPAVADLEGDGIEEIIFGSDDNNLYVFSLTAEGLSNPNMDLKWMKSLSVETKVPVSAKNRDDRDEIEGLDKHVYLGEDIYSTPAIGQLDEDSQLEIVVGVENGNLFAFNHDGSVVEGHWPVQLSELIRSSAAIGDINGDGLNEVVVGCFDQKIYAFDRQGNLLEGWPVTTGGSITSSPTLVNLDSDQDTLEILIGSSDGFLYALDYEGSSIGENWPLRVYQGEGTSSNDIDSSPAVADFNHDGINEIVVGSDGGFVHFIDADGNELWHVATGGEVFASPAIADLGGDSVPEILIGSDVELESGQRASILLALDRQGNRLDAYTVEYGVAEYGETRLRSSPLVVDLDRDGQLEIVQAIYRLADKSGSVFVYDLPQETKQHSSEFVPCPMFRQNLLRNGVVALYEGPLTPTHTPTDTPTGGIPPTISPTITLTPTITPSPEISNTPTLVPTDTETPVSTDTPTLIPTDTPLDTMTATPTSPTATPTSTPILQLGDYNLDGRIDPGDLWFYSKYWKTTAQNKQLGNFNPALDIHVDGVIDEKDLLLLEKQWKEDPVLFPPDVSPRQVTSGDGDDTDPSFSPDRNQLAFISTRTSNTPGNYDLSPDCYVVDLLGDFPDQNLLEVTVTDQTGIPIQYTSWAAGIDNEPGVRVTSDFISRVPLIAVVSPLPVTHTAEGILNVPPFLEVSIEGTDIFGLSDTTAIPETEDFIFFQYREVLQGNGYLCELILQSPGANPVVLYSATTDFVIYGNPDWGPVG